MVCVGLAIIFTFCKSESGGDFVVSRRASVDNLYTLPLYEV